MINKFAVDYQAELELCKQFLRQDQRNFHCWNYRRFVVEAAGIAPEAELLFSQEKIQENFSNYSAFHHRTLFLQRSGLTARESLDTEFSFVENAIFTEPADQSAWWYHQFLLSWATAEVRALQSEEVRIDAVEWLAGVLQEQFALVEGLWAEEAECTWVMTCLLNIIDTLVDPLLAAALPTDQAQALLAKRVQILQALIETDPIHKQRYQYLLLKHPLE